MTLLEQDFDNDKESISFQPKWLAEQQSDLLPSLAERLDKRHNILRVKLKRPLVTLKARRFVRGPAWDSNGDADCLYYRLVTVRVRREPARMVASKRVTV